MHNNRTRTTSAVEAYNGVLGKGAEKNGHFFKFVGLIRDEEFFKSRHFSMLCESGGSLSKKKRTSSSIRNKEIENATLLLHQGNITVAAFLSRMVYEKNSICVNMLPKQDIFKEDSSDESSDEESVVETPNNENTCVVCMFKIPNVVLLPCKHLKICNECNLKLQADAISRDAQLYNCPYCRQTVHDSMLVFT